MTGNLHFAYQNIAYKLIFIATLARAHCYFRTGLLLSIAEQLFCSSQVTLNEVADQDKWIIMCWTEIIRAWRILTMHCFSFSLQECSLESFHHTAPFRMRFLEVSGLHWFLFCFTLFLKEALLIILWLYLLFWDMILALISEIFPWKKPLKYFPNIASENSSNLLLWRSRET